jgi:hypothetical protein
MDGSSPDGEPMTLAAVWYVVLKKPLRSSASNAAWASNQRRRIQPPLIACI